MISSLSFDKLWSWPNFFSYLRIILTPIFLYLAYKGYDTWAIVCFLTAGLTDWIDGFLARILHQETSFGQILDPIADKIFLIASYIGFWYLHRIPDLVCAIVVGRDLLLLLMGACVLSLKLSFSMKPLYISKLNTNLQIVYIVCVSLALNTYVIHIMGIMTLITTILSGFLYLYSFLSWYTRT